MKRTNKDQDNSRRPFTAIPATRSAKSRRRKEWFVVGAWIALASLGPLSFIMVARRPNQVQPPAQQQVSEYPVATVSFAQIVAEDFLAHRPTNMPAVTGVDATFGFQAGGSAAKFDYISITPYTTQDKILPMDNGTTRKVTVTFFRVQQPPPASKLWDVQVTTTTDSEGRPLLAAVPSLKQPSLAASDSIGPTDYSNAPGANPIGPISSAAILAWATPFAANDTKQLTLTVSTGRPDNAKLVDPVVGLGGFVIEGTPQMGKAVSSTYCVGYSYLRVVLNLRDTTSGFTAPFAYDLLLKQRGSDLDSYSVVGWGPPGSGPSLSTVFVFDSSGAGCP